MKFHIRLFWTYRIAIILFFCSGSIYISGQRIEKMEPPNWWTGMVERDVQIMLYGSDIGHLLATTDYPGVSIHRCGYPGSKNYLFIDMRIQPDAKPGDIKIKLKEGTKKKTEITFPLLARAPQSAQRRGHAAHDVIYMLTPDRFANGDPTNDAVENMSEKPQRENKNGRHGGDLEGIRQHLDYISDMGFTAVWPNPFLENNMPRYSYHGYSTTDFYKTDPRMGTNELVRQLCKEANEKGIKVIMDMIVNHCGDQHWWMTDPPTHDWFNYYNQPYVGTNHRKTLMADPYAAPEDRKIMEDGWFVRTMPDLNVRNPWLATYLIQNSIWWIEYAGLHGIRMDTYLYPEETFMSRWAERIMKEYPNFNISGEVWYDNPAFVSYWQKGKTNPNGYVSHLPSLFDFPLHTALVKSLMTPDRWNEGWIYLYEMLAQDFLYPDPQNLVVFTDNHDMPRIFTQLGNDISKLKTALVFTLTVRGIPQLYYGTEILMASPENRDDGLIRSDFPGGWANDEINAFTGHGLMPAQKEMQSWLRHLLQWRKTAPAVHAGKTTHYVPEGGVYVIFRSTENQKLMIVLNKNENPIVLSMDRFKREIGQHTTGMEVLSKTKISLLQDIHIDKPGPLIIELE